MYIQQQQQEEREEDGSAGCAGVSEKCRGREGSRGGVRRVGGRRERGRKEGEERRSAMLLRRTQAGLHSHKKKIG